MNILTPPRYCLEIEAIPRNISPCPAYRARKINSRAVPMTPSIILTATSFSSLFKTSSASLANLLNTLLPRTLQQASFSTPRAIPAIAAIVGARREGMVGCAEVVEALQLNRSAVASRRGEGAARTGFFSRERAV
jgi:hypothetical protein